MSGTGVGMLGYGTNVERVGTEHKAKRDTGGFLKVGVLFTPKMFKNVNIQETTGPIRGQTNIGRLNQLRSKLNRTIQPTNGPPERQDAGGSGHCKTKRGRQNKHYYFVL